ncbi:MAG TPA: hypothetical protein PK054_04120, partial [Anaerohalosphaeraceae bacterium]|nr:hypothetical protein [Anaerohalosphaeraceae bacterium]
TGNSEHKIDLGDLAVFCEDNPQVWLWRACWEQSRMNFIQTTLYPMIGGRESMMSMREFVFPAENLSATEQTKKSIEQQILKMEEAIDFLEKIWLGEPNIQEEINPEDWQEFMKAVYKGLFELQTQNVQVE